MDLLNEIVKEIGSDYAKIASDKKDTERLVISLIGKNDMPARFYKKLISG